MIRTICENISFDSAVITEVESDRLVPAEELAEIFRKYTKQPVEAIASIPDAFETALEKKGDGILFCVGSLYLVGSLKSILRSKQNA